MAASSSTGRVLTLCRQFQSVCRISSTFGPQHAAVNLHKCQTRLLGEIPPLVPSFWSRSISSVAQCRTLHTTISRRGLDEFFDLPENWGENTVKSGAPWTATQLRTKSNEDLHKLWYVLLKEKNMLLTIEQEAKRQRLQMPSPERIRKIERSMIRLETVVQERETGARLLQTGQEKGRPGAWRKNVFGHTYWYRFREYAIPWYMNRRYKLKRFYTPPFVQAHMRLRLEKKLQERSRKKTLRKQSLEKLKKRFPQMKVPAS